MVHQVWSLVLVVGLITLTHCAPTETESTTVAANPTPSATTVTSSSTPVVSTNSAAESASTSAPATAAGKDSASNTTASMAVGSASEQSKLNNTNFTCYGRDVGYYADVQLECRVYHFCLPGDFNGEPVFQRISYLCLNETVFDQQALDCVSSDKLTAPCAEADRHYEESNKVLRQAILRQGDKSSSVSSASTTTTPQV